MPESDADRKDEERENRITEQLNRLISEKGSSAEALRVLFDERVQDRIRIRELKRDLAESRKAVPEGGVVLTADEGKKWEAFTKLGKTPEELTASLTAATKNEKDLAELREEKGVREAARDGKVNPEVLLEVVRGRRLVVEVKKVKEKVDGKDVEKNVPHVRPAGDEKAEWQPLDAYAEKELPEPLRVALGTVDATAPTPRKNGNSGSRYPTQQESRRTPAALTDEELVEAKRATGAYVV